MTSIDPTPYEDDEISLVDIFRFLLRNGKFILATTLGFALLGVGFSLTRTAAAPQDSRTLELEILSHTIPVTHPIQSTVRTTPLAVIYEEALAAVQADPPEDVTVSGTYDSTQQKLLFTLTAPTPAPLKTAPKQITATVATAIADRVASAVPPTRNLLNREIEQAEQLIAALEAELAATTSALRQQALETERATIKSTQLTKTLALAELTPENLPRLTTELFPVAILDESEITQSSGTGRSPLQMGILSMIAGFMVATLAAIIWEQIPHWRAELAAAQAATRQPSDPQ